MDSVTLIFATGKSTVAATKELVLTSYARLTLCLLLIVGCNSKETKPQAAATAAVSAKDSPMPFQVIEERVEPSANSVEMHVLIAAGPKHDDLQKLLEFLYRYLMKRNDEEPTAAAAYVYSDAAQYKTPPRSPIGSVVRMAGTPAPKFENKIPLEFWQQVKEALPRAEKKKTLNRNLSMDPLGKSLTITEFYTEPGKDEWAKTASFYLAMNVFVEDTRALFEKVPELRGMTFTGTWKDEPVVKITLNRAMYDKLDLPKVDEAIGELHGRAYLEMSTGRGSDEKISKANQKRMTDIYRKMIKTLGKQAVISSKLK